MIILDSFMQENAFYALTCFIRPSMSLEWQKNRKNVTQIFPRFLLLHCVIFLQKFQSRKSSAPIIKIQNTSPDASSSQESISTLPPVGNICPYFENADHSYCPDCEDNNKYQQQPCCDGVNCYRSSQYSEVNSLLNNLNRLTSCNCDECHQLWFDGSVVNSKLQVCTDYFS